MIEYFELSRKKVIFSFADSVPTEVDIDGVLHCRRSEKQLELTLVGTEEGQIAEWAKSVGAEEYHTAKMNLEDQFIEFAASAERF